VSDDLGFVIEYLTSSVLRDIDLFDIIFKKIIVQEVHVNDFLHRFSVGKEIVSSETRKDKRQETLRLGLVVLVEKELFPLVSTILFVVATFLSAAAVCTTLAVTLFL